MQNSRGIHVELGEMIKSGGEAKIFEVRDQPNLVAKVYHADKLRMDRESKLKAMLANVPTQPATHTALAWPIDLLYKRRRFVGFLMPKIKAYDRIFNFYNPVLRKKQHPGFNLQYLHRVASNLAIVVETVHQAGHVVGDLNESNVLVNDRALVTLVDTDSFQIKESERSIYHCVVGKAEYTPPELQGVSFYLLDRHREQDYFGLAVLIFQLLMQGYHPFSGVLPSHLSVGRVDVYAIKKGLFPYQQNSKSLGIQTPPNAPPFTHLDPALQALFIRCFVDGHKNPSQRPTAREWRGFLQKAEQMLITCEHHPIHIYSSHLGSCPFCPSDQVKQVPLPAAGRMPAQRTTLANALSQSSTAKKRYSDWELFYHMIILVMVAISMTMLGSFGTTFFTGADETANQTPSVTTEAPNTPYPAPSEQGSYFDLPNPAPLIMIGAQNADKIEQLAYFQNEKDEKIEEVAYSPDGKLLAVASWVGIYMLDANTLQQLNFIDTNFAVHSVAFSPDGQILASGLVNGTLHLWDTSGRAISTLSGHSHWINRVAFSPDGQTLATASSDETVRLWDTSGKAIITLSDHTDWVRSVTFSPDGQTLASGSRDGEVRLWEASGTSSRQLSGHTWPVRTLAFSPDGQILASGTEDNMVRLWSVDGTLLNTLSKHISDVESVTFSQDGSLVVSGDSLGTIHLWSRDGTLVSTVSEHISYVKSLAISHDGKLLASASFDGTVRLWGVKE